MRVLLADDERTILKTLGDALSDAGYDLLQAATGDAAVKILDDTEVECLITDIKMPGVSGIELLQRARELYPDISVIVITGHGSVESAVEAMKAGATDYVTKPFLNDDVLMRVARIRRELSLADEVRRLKGELSTKYKFENLVGASDVMQRLFGQIRNVARNVYDVLITGESGTGKELVARAIHHNSPRARKAFVAVSCAALPETLLEDELFGHEKGAFTDARDRRQGRFELADGGTIFFDDIDDMSLRTQVKLLRVLQERTFERLGGSKTIRVDLRTIAATKIDLQQKVEKGEFREDLYYRLNVVPLHLAPLRRRPEDIPVLCEHFINTFGGGKNYQIEPETYEAMASHAWPGNVRELENSVKRALALSTVPGVLSRKYLVPVAQFPVGGGAPSGPVPLREVVAASEKAHILSVLNLTGGNRTKAAEILGISRKNLWEKMRAYELL
jgi:DNA-binding NtrC family response regulator